MWSSVKVKIAPEVAPMAAADLRARLRIDSASEDGLLDQFLATALGAVDGPDGIGVALMAQTWTLTLDRFLPAIDLPGWPVSAVSAVRYLDQDGVEQALDPADWRLVTGSDPARLLPAIGKVWPAAYRGPGAVMVDYVLGVEDPADLRADLVTALALLVGHYYENREAVASAQLRDLPLGVDYILNRYRRGMVA